MPDLIANSRMTYGTRRLQAGDRFPASKQDARVLVALGKASHAPAAEQVQPPAATAAATEPQAAQESATEATGAAAAVVKTEPAAPVQGKRRASK